MITFDFPEVTYVPVVINKCYGGFNLSDAAVAFIVHRRGYIAIREGMYLTFDGETVDEYEIRYEIPRTDPDLVAAVEQMGKAAGGSCSSLDIVKVETGTRYRIQEYDGAEWIMTEDDLTFTA